MQITKLFKDTVKGNNATTLLVFNLFLFAIFIIGSFFASFSTAWLLISFLIYFLSSCCGISITYHRALTHKALVMPKWLERLFATFASMAGTGSPIMWVITHRQHHRHADKDGDPHPPTTVYKTIFGVYPKVTGYIRDIVADKYYVFWHRNYFGILTAYIAFIYFMFGFNALYFIALLPMVTTIVISNALNWYGHKQSSTGYRNYDLKDHSQNNIVMALLAFGEGWHNNHHRHPGSAKFGIRAAEIDISFVVIKLLEKLGLVNNIRLPNEKFKRI
jgi:stearoyl-CoA desaturase (delta-9 desaturase)